MDNLNVGDFLSKNVTIGTVVTLLFALTLTYMGVKKALTSFTSLFKSFPAAWVTAGFLTICGLASTGYGVGELGTGPRESVSGKRQPLGNEDVMKIATSTSLSKDLKLDAVKMALAYAEKRDEKARELGSLAEPEVIEQVPVGSRRFGWMLLLGGLAGTLSGACIFLGKINGWYSGT